MKNPIVHFKHLVKDPITNLDDAEARKKEIMPWFLGCIAAGVLFGLLSGIEALNFLSFVLIIPVAGIMFFGFLLSVIATAKKTFKVLTCEKCNTMPEIPTAEDFAKYVSYTVEKDEATFNGVKGYIDKNNQSVYSTVSASGKASAVLNVTLTCPKCGEVKHLKYCASPLVCNATKSEVPMVEYHGVSRMLEDSVRAVVEEYNDPARRNNILHTFHSSKNPHYVDRYKFKGANAAGAKPVYNGVYIEFRKDIEEMILHEFVLKERFGNFSDPSKPKKSK
ncbi:MAG: hypothetical protein IJD22_04540 [Clostridia bacterium]|nr:hypothetical protein [Clostridia bacterium]